LRQLAARHVLAQRRQPALLWSKPESNRSRAATEPAMETGSPAIAVPGAKAKDALLVPSRNCRSGIGPSRIVQRLPA
jgi:hypothetical protein